MCTLEGENGRRRRRHGESQEAESLTIKDDLETPSILSESQLPSTIL